MAGPFGDNCADSAQHIAHSGVCTLFNKKRKRDCPNKAVTVVELSRPYDLELACNAHMLNIAKRVRFHTERNITTLLLGDRPINWKPAW